MNHLDEHRNFRQFIKYAVPFAGLLWAALAVSRAMRIDLF